jgi:hypothetical protein
MPDPASLAMIEFLTWVSSRRRTYAEAMEAWRSTCPRHTVWEDALADALIRFEGGKTLREYEVVLTPRGESILGASRGERAGEREAGRGLSDPPSGI